MRSFNPLRGRSPAEIAGQRGLILDALVSIRCGAAAPQKSRTRSREASAARFQSAAGPQPRRNSSGMSRSSTAARFNPLRGRSPAEICSPKGKNRPRRRFNPLRGRSPAEIPGFSRLRGYDCFNPLRGRSPAEIALRHNHLALHPFQSAAGPQPRRNVAAHAAETKLAVSIRCGAAAPQKWLSV